MLIELVDGGVTNISTDVDYTSGCETCDWGATYVNEYNIIMTKGAITAKVENDSRTTFSEGLMMELILKNIDIIRELTENQFTEWLETELKSRIKNIGESSYFEEVELDFNYIKSGNG